MPVTTMPIKKEETNGSITDKNKVMEAHTTAALHHTEAAKHHTEAAKHHADGNHEKAAVSTVKAQGHYKIAAEHHDEIAKQHAMAGK